MKQTKKSKLSPLDRVLRFLSFRSRSEAEIRKYLDRFEIEIEKREEIISRLKGLRFIDDEEFAKTYIESRSRSHPRSQRLLQLELRRKGVKLDPIPYTLPPDDELAKLALEKKHNIKSHDQAIRFLQSRGFSWEIIQKVLKLADVN